MKETGITMTLTVDGSSGVARDISNDVTNFDFGTPRAMQDVTGLDKLANERLLLLADFSININGVYNPAAQKSHAVFETVPVQTSTELRTVKVAVSGSTLVVETLFSDYALTRAATGELTWNAPGQGAGGTVPTWG